MWGETWPTCPPKYLREPITSSEELGHAQYLYAGYKFLREWHMPLNSSCLDDQPADYVDACLLLDNLSNEYEQQLMDAIKMKTPKSKGHGRG